MPKGPKHVLTVTPRPPADSGPPETVNLTFDPATKTFAHSFVVVRLEAYRRERARLWADLLRFARGAGTDAEVAALAARTRALIEVIDGGTVDLVPGVADKLIPSVQRLQALHKHMKARVLPIAAKLARPGEKIRARIEFQMGQNVKAGKIVCGLVALLDPDLFDVSIVAPATKSTIALCEGGRYCYFVEKCGNLYLANKAHAKFNFEWLEDMFTSRVPPSSRALRGHIADTVMLTLADIKRGPGATVHF